MNNIETFVHIGLCKTGTSFLQQCFFPAIDGIHYINVHASWLDEIIYKNDFDFEYKKVRSNFKTFISANSLPVLISNESLAGNFLHGAMDTTMIANRLHAMHDDLKIIITIRNQMDMIDSLYRQYVHQGGALSFLNFMKLGAPNPIYAGLSYLNYYKLVSLYCGLFGRKNVLILKYEDLNCDYKLFLRQILDFIGVDYKHDLADVFVKKNVGLSDLAIFIMRVINRFVPSWANSASVIPHRILTSHKVRIFFQNKLDPLLFRKISKKENFVIAAGMKDQIISYYREDNQHLCDEFAIDIDKYDYPL